MAHELAPIDIAERTDLAALVEEVATTGKRRRFTRGTREMAVLSPIAPPTRRRVTRPYSEADDAAFLASAGSWKDVDTDKLVADIYESRRSSRPPVDL